MAIALVRRIEIDAFSEGSIELKLSHPRKAVSVCPRMNEMTGKKIMIPRRSNTTQPIERRIIAKLRGLCSRRQILTDNRTIDRFSLSK